MGSKQYPEYNYIFGPVPSRRLGISLGVDLLPHKTCSLDCVYCECGGTTHLTLKQKEYIHIDQVRQELDRFLSTNPELNYITFSGSGEPTLNSGIGEIIGFLKTDYPQYKVALITNSTLFSNPETRKRVCDVDLIMASLDAVSPDIFKRINRPHPFLEPASMMEGVIALRKEYINRLWMEIFIVPGFNDKENELKKIRKFLDKITPEVIHINSLDRPGTEAWVNPVDKHIIQNIHNILSGADLIKNNSCDSSKRVLLKDCHDHIVSTIRRRPCTADDISKITGARMEMVNRLLDFLIKNGEIERKIMPRGTFYVPRA